MTDRFVLRPATRADIPALAALGRDSFVAKFGTLYRPEDLAAFLEQVHSIEGVTSDWSDPVQRYMLAEADGALVGYCKIAVRCGWPEYARGRRPMELKQLYTAPDATGRGIGAALMDWAMSELAREGADEVQLSVYSGNTGAQGFYARYGFAKVADITFAVGQQIDHEFLFAKML